MGAVHRRGCLTLQAADEPLRWASGRPRGEGRGPVAPPVFKTGLSLLVGDGRFDSFPSPPALPSRRSRSTWSGRGGSDSSALLASFVWVVTAHSRESCATTSHSARAAGGG